MTRRIFLDVGANTGQSLAIALAYDFDLIECFEPAPPCWKHLWALADERVNVWPIGLSNRTEQLPLYEPGRKGASMWAKHYARSHESTLCEFVRASDWFRDHLEPTDRVWLKLNCEGAESAIIEDLLDSGEWSKVTHALVSWHGHKIPEVGDAEADLRKMLEVFPYVRWDTPLADWLGATA